MPYKPNYKLKYITLDEKLDFGKHKGLEFAEILRIDPGYLKWCKINVKGFRLSKEIIKEHNLDKETYEKLT